MAQTMLASSLEYDVLSINEHSPRQSADVYAR